MTTNRVSYILILHLTLSSFLPYFFLISHLLPPITITFIVGDCDEIQNRFMLERQS